MLRATKMVIKKTDKPVHPQHQHYTAYDALAYYKEAIKRWKGQSRAGRDGPDGRRYIHDNTI